MARLKYMHIKYYADFLKGMKRKNMKFEVDKTSYSRKITSKGLTVFFNEDGGSDHDSLGLINMVRQNAKSYMANTSFEQRNEKINFSELIKMPKSGEIIKKVDIRSAYWNAALKRGVIEEATNKKLLDAFEHKSADAMKRARLKALGSLATRKTKEYWEPGEKTSKKVKEERICEPTKDLYMDICRDVDSMMRECIQENEEVVFYYWDCIFIPEGFEAGVVNYFKNKNYDVSVGVTKLEFVNIAGTNWVLSQSDDKAYLVRRESRALIQDL